MADEEGPLLVGGNCDPIIVKEVPRRLDKLYDNWDLYLGKADIFLLQTPQNYTGGRTLKSSIFSVWLFGVEFLNTTFLFTKKTIHAFCNDEYNASLLEVLEDAVRKSKHSLTLLTYNMAGSGEEFEQIENIYNEIRSPSTPTINVGCLHGNSSFNTWLRQRNPAGVYIIDVTDTFAELFVVKDKYSLAAISQSAFLSYQSMDHWAVNVLRYVVNSNRRASHSSLSQDLMAAILKPHFLKVGLKPEAINFFYPPVVQSGNDFDFSASVQSNDKNLVYGRESVIICMIRLSYNDHYSCVVRTFLVNPSYSQIETYKLLLKVQKAVIQALQAGAKLNDAYESGRTVVQRRKPELLQNLTISAGSGIGIEFSESNLILDACNDKIVESGMVFKVVIGFEDVKRKNKRFSMLLGDTVIIKTDGSPKCVTPSFKKLEFVTHPFFLNESPKQGAEEVGTMEQEASTSQR